MKPLTVWIGLICASLMISCQSGSIAKNTSCSTQSTPIWSSQFESNWQDQWGIKPNQAWGEKNREVMRGQRGKFSTFLRVRYPAGSASPRSHNLDNTPIGGTQFFATLNQLSHDALCLSYWVRFSPNFEFIKGGKLPGLFGGTVNDGRKIPDGTNGFSARYMWRRNGNGEVYAYLPTSVEHGTSMPLTHGNVRGNWQFQPGQWYHLEERVILNTPNANNGSVTVWVNNQLVLNQTDLQFRTTPTLKIDGILFSTFFGGGDRTWATPRSVYADFANVQIYAVD